MPVRAEEAEPTPAAGTAIDRLALGATYVLNPLIMPVVGMAVVARIAGALQAQVAAVIAVGTIFFAVGPLAVVISLLRRGRVDSIEIRNRRARIRPLAVGMGMFAAGAYVLSLLNVPGSRMIVGLAVLLVLNTFLILLITLRWKVSLHAAGAGGLVGLLLFLNFAPLGQSIPSAALAVPTVLAIIALPVVMWSRLRLHAHTPAQVTVGALFGIFLSPMELYSLWLTGFIGLP